MYLGQNLRRRSNNLYTRQPRYRLVVCRWLLYRLLDRRLRFCHRFSQTEPVLVKGKDCKSPTGNLNEYLGISVSVQIERQELNFAKCIFCSENFKTKGDLVAHIKQKVKICSKFTAGIHCTYGSESCLYIHKGKET